MTDKLDMNLAALSTWMDRRGLGEGPLLDIVPLGGGTQNVILRFRRGDRLYVLRRPPLHLRANSNETMRREARMLAALAGTKVPHPSLIAACPEEDVIGAAFYLMEPVEGFNSINGMPPLHAGSPEIRHRMGLAMVEAIAALGSLDYRALGLDGFGRPENYLERQVDRWQFQLAGYAEHAGWPGPAEIPGVDQMAAWLRKHRPRTFQPGIIHGDYHIGNVLFRTDGPNLAAVVDWELATVGDPLVDLGWLVATWQEDDNPRKTDFIVKPWFGFPTTDELVAHYHAHSDRDLSAIHWYAVMACYKLGIILEGTYARACAGLAPIETGRKLHSETIRLFEHGRRWMN